MTVKRIGTNHWEVRVSYGYQGNRTFLKRRLHGSKADAQKLEAKLLLKAGKTTAPKASLTLSDYIDNTWLPSLEVTDYTKYTYGLHMAKVMAALGHYRLSGISPQALESYFAGVPARTLARKQFETLRTALNAAVRWELLEVNPCTKISPPKKPRKQSPVIYSPEEVRTIMERIRGEWFEPLWLLGIFCGLRPEEVTALDVPDRDWDGTLTIDRAYAFQGGGNGWKLAETKTEASTDTVEVPPEIVERILDITDRQSGPLGALRGKRINRSEYLGRYKAFCERESLPYIPPKNFRHTAATLMLIGGVELPVVSRVLRHTQVSTTANVYLGILDEAKQDASNKLYKLISEG